MIHTQPSPTATTGQAIPTQPVVYEEDQYGNLETGDSTTQVTASLRLGTGPLLGTTTVTVTRGIAVFTNLADNTAETVILTFTGPGLDKATSNPIIITDPPKAHVVTGSAKAHVKVGVSEISRAKSRHAIRGDRSLTTTKGRTHAPQRPCCQANRKPCERANGRRSRLSRQRTARRLSSGPIERPCVFAGS